MKLAFIEPISELDHYFTNYHLILPQVVEYSEEYATHFVTTPGYKILDNGVAEAAPMDWDRLIEIAYELDVDEIVVPDVMGDGAATVTAARAFFKVARPHLSKFKFMGVAQGASEVELGYCIDWFADQGWVDVLALPRILNRQFGKFTRARIVEDNYDQIASWFEAIHCLGASEWNKEPLVLSEIPVRGMDTSFPAVMSLMGRSVDAEYVSRSALEEKCGPFWELYMHPSRRSLADRNHYIYSDWCANDE